MLYTLVNSIHEYDPSFERGEKSFQNSNDKEESNSYKYRSKSWLMPQQYVHNDILTHWG